MSSNPTTGRRNLDALTAATADLDADDRVTVNNVLLGYVSGAVTADMWADGIATALDVIRRVQATRAAIVKDREARR